MPSQRLPPARNVGEAIDAAPTLAALLEGHRRAEKTFRLVQPLLPPTLQPWVRPGPVAEGCWTLFAENSSASAKLRQLLPLVLERAREADASLTAIKVKILPRSG